MYVMHKIFTRIGIRKTRNTDDSLGSGTKLLLPSWILGFSTQGERHTWCHSLPQFHFLSGGFIMTSVIVTSSLCEREHLRSMCALTRALSRKVLSRTKPKDKIKPTKNENKKKMSFRSYITHIASNTTRKSQSTHRAYNSVFKPE